MATILMSSCKKLVDIPPPVSQLVTTSVFNNDNTAIAAQLGVYTQMQDLPWSVDYYCGLSSDEFTNYSTSQPSIDLYSNALSATNDGDNLFWSLLYKYIYQENAIVSNVQSSNGISDGVKKLLIGEAKFMRAYFYFHLVNFYGDVPLITTTDYKINSLMARSPKGDVYRQIISDLKDAQSQLSAKYLDATDSVVTVDRVRPTTWAASALLSRVYLYNGNYDSAEAQASIVVNNAEEFSLVSLDSVFLANSNEAIFQIVPPSSSLYTYEGNYFILSVPPVGGGINNSSSLSPQILNAFESGDNRMLHWVDSLSDGTNTWYFPFKYKSNSLNAVSLTEYSMVLRLGELYLIRAEARARQNKLSEAISDLNAIRIRAGLTGLDNTLNQTQVISAIAHERQVELFSEGHRWFDLKRTNTVDDVMKVVTPQKWGAWNSYQQLYPLSTTELQAGVNLKQNTGY